MHSNITLCIKHCLALEPQHRYWALKAQLNRNDELLINLCWICFFFFFRENFVRYEPEVTQSLTSSAPKLRRDLFLCTCANVCFVWSVRRRVSQVTVQSCHSSARLHPKVLRSTGLNRHLAAPCYQRYWDCMKGVTQASAYASTMEPLAPEVFLIKNRSFIHSHIIIFTADAIIKLNIRADRERNTASVKAEATMEEIPTALWHLPWDGALWYKWREGV